MAEIERLLNELLCGDDVRAESAALMLIKSGEGAFSKLKVLVKDQDPEVRWWALRTISEFDHPLVATVLHEALQDTTIEVQMCAILGLRNHPNENAIEDLAKFLNSHDRLLARLAADALIFIGPLAVSTLLNKVNEKDHNTRLEVIRALAHIRDERAVPVFFEIVKGGDSALLNYWADVGLQKLGIGMTFYTPE